MSFIENKAFKPKAVAEIALKYGKVLHELLDGVLSKKDAIRYGIFMVLEVLSEKHPERLYSEWDFFVDLWAATTPIKST